MSALPSCPEATRPTWMSAAALPCLIVACQLSAGVACTTRNPATGRVEVVLMSEEKEKAIDEEAVKSIEAQMGLLKDDALADYIDKLGQALAEHSPRKVEYHFDIVEMEEPNAFALPGGHIFLSKGLLLLANSEAEIANVLGHEIGHVAARHAAQRDAHMKTLGIATLLGTLASGSSKGAGRSGRIGPGGFYAYSREQEREADSLGQDIVISAGVDPMGMSAFLRNLENSTRLTQGFSSRDNYFASHPATSERIVEAETTAQLRRWTPSFSIAPTRDDYLQRIEGLTIGRSAAEGIERGNYFIHADLDFSVRFPDGWEILNMASQVIGVAPNQRALTMLEIQEPGVDPRRAAEAYLSDQARSFEAGSSIRIGELDAYRARGTIPTPGGPADAEITWIAHRGNIFRLTAGSFGASFHRSTGVFRSFARSFRPLRDEERESIYDLRLRLVKAVGGERLTDLDARVDNEWNLNELAVYNDLPRDAVLTEGQVIKIAVLVPYQPDAAEPEGLEWEGEGPEPGTAPPHATNAGDATDAGD